jgi:hypothetical protein
MYLLHEGEIYERRSSITINDFPSPVIMKYHTSVKKSGGYLVLAPGTEYIDITSMFNIERCNPLYVHISCNTDLPVIINHNGKMYLISGNPPDSSYDLFEEYVGTMVEKHQHIPLNARYFMLYSAKLSDHPMEKLPYKQFCKDRGIKYIDDYHYTITL